MRKLFAEYLGTFALVFCGTGAIIIDADSAGAVSHVGVAITFGLIIMTMIYAFGSVSGAHFNPAVTVAFAAKGSFKWKSVPTYILSQLAGALTASVILKMLFPNDSFLGSTMPAHGEWQSFVLEIILSFFLMLVIIQVSTGSKEVGMFAGIAIGGVILLEAMFAGPITGASMNPIRSLAPAIVSTHIEHLWIYLAAPFVGTVLAVGAGKLLAE